MELRSAIHAAFICATARDIPATMTDLAHTDIGPRLARAESACAQRGARLTDTRRTVLELILQAREPVGAYTLLDQLRARHGQGKPPTIYRALDFLLAQGLIHRVERLNAFVGCHEEALHPHPVQFLICARCGAVNEFEDKAISHAIGAVALRSGFVVSRATVEVEGECAGCHAALSNTATVPTQPG